LVKYVKESVVSAVKLCIKKKKKKPVWGKKNPRHREESGEVSKYKYTCTAHADNFLPRLFNLQFYMERRPTCGLLF
jgi:hypothetical protein